MARMTYAQAVDRRGTIGYFIHRLLAPLASGKNPDGTDYTLPVEITNISGDVTLNVDEVDSLKVTNADGDTLDVALPARSSGTVGLAAAQLTAAIPVPAGAKMLSLYLPALTSCTFSIQASIGGTNYATLNGKEGSESTGYSFPACVGGFVIALIPVGGLHSIKLNSAAVNQTATFEYGFI